MQPEDWLDGSLTCRTPLLREAACRLPPPSYTGISIFPAQPKNLKEASCKWARVATVSVGWANILYFTVSRAVTKSQIEPRPGAIVTLDTQDPPHHPVVVSPWWQRGIDGLSTSIGRLAAWLIPLMVFVSAANAVARYLFSASSNGWLEVQWYLFATCWLLAGGYTLLRDEHVRVDVLTSRWSTQRRAIIDLVGLALFLMPFSLLMIYWSWPPFWQSLLSLERSSDAGGLIRWPVRLLLPAGFLLLTIQAAVEISRRVARLRSDAPSQ